jgi:hypothetical protein
MRYNLRRFLQPVVALAIILFAGGVVRAQSSAANDNSITVLPPNLFASTSTPFPALPSAAAPSPDGSDIPMTAALVYSPPSGDQKFRNFLWNAIGPVAFAGASLAGAIDQGADFPHQWGQGANAYAVRVASNLGISLVSATSEYAIAEAFGEDTAYYRCTCRGFFPRFWHAAMSTVAARRGEDGHYAFSPALTVSPFIGPMVAANTWIPSRDGSDLGAHMGAYNLLGQFAQNEALEFLYGGPHTLLAAIRRHLFKESDSDTKP